MQDGALPRAYCHQRGYPRVNQAAKGDNMKTEKKTSTKNCGKGSTKNCGKGKTKDCGKSGASDCGKGSNS